MILVIHNPVSGRKKFLDAGRLCKKYLDKQKIRYEWFSTLPQERQPFEQISFEKFTRVIVIGGDGTVREVVSYIVRKKLDIPIAIIPAGTGNLLAVSLGIPFLSIPRMIRLAIEGEAKSYDVGAVNDEEYFLIGCGKGHDAMMMKAANRSFKRRFGFAAYIFALGRQVFHFRRLQFRVEVDGEMYKFKARTVLVFNMIAVFGMLKKYEIRPDDGRLNVVILQASTFWALGKALAHLLNGSAHLKKSGLKFLSGKHIVITTKQRDIPVEIDGDVVQMERVEVKVKEKAVRLVGKR